MATRINRMQLKNLLARGYRVVSHTPGMISAAEWVLGLQLPRYAGRSTSAE